MLLFIGMLLGKVPCLEARVVDHLVECQVPHFEGTLEIARPDAKVVDLTQEGVNQRTEISTFSESSSIVPVKLDSPIRQSQVALMAPHSYYIVNLTVHPEKQLLFSLIPSGHQVSYQTKIKNPTHLFVLDIDGDQKQDIVIGNIDKKEGSIIFYYQVLLNKTSDFSPNNEPLRVILEEPDQIKEVGFSGEDAGLPKDWIVSLVNGKPSFIVFHESYSLVYDLNADGSVGSSYFSGLWGGYKRVKSKALNVNPRNFPELKDFELLTLYEKEGEDSFLVFEDLNDHNVTKQTFIFDQLDYYLPEGSQIIDFFFPLEFEGEIAILLTHPQENTQYLSCFKFSQINSRNQVNWDYNDNSSFTNFASPRIVHKSLVSGNWLVVWEDKQGWIEEIIDRHFSDPS